MEEVTELTEEGTLIKEINPEVPIIISKFNFTCDDEDVTINPPLPQAGGFAMFIIGQPGSGKSNLLLNLTTKAHKNFNRKFDHVYLWSPSCNSMEDNPFELLPEDQKFEELNLANLREVLDEIKDSEEKVLFIFDDVITDMRGKGKIELENELQKVFFNRRHKAGKGGSLSIIATSQVYNLIALKIRKTMSHLILFETKDKVELKSIYDGIITIPKKEFFDVLSYVFDKPYSFLYIVKKLKDDKMFFKNFTHLEVSSKNIMSGGFRFIKD